jgi:hypothetical protein
MKPTNEAKFAPVRRNRWQTILASDFVRPGGTRWQNVLASGFVEHREDARALR